MSTPEHTLKTGWILLSLAIKFFDEFRRGMKLEKTEKHNFNFQLQRLEAVDKHLKLSTSPELASIINKEITENWDTLSITNVLHIMAELPDEERILVENFAEQTLNAYLQKHGTDISTDPI